MYCSQSAVHRRERRPSQKPDAYHHGMKWFECQGELDVRVKPHPRDFQARHVIIVHFKHWCKHAAYVFVETPPEAVEYIKTLLFSPPTLVVTKIQEKWSHLRAKQIYRIWTQLAGDLWRRDPNPMESAKKFIREWPAADLWEFELPEGVVALAWGMKDIGVKIGKCIVETGLDATCACLPPFCSF
jgi:hypothetical protein